MTRPLHFLLGRPETGRLRMPVARQMRFLPKQTPPFSSLSPEHRNLSPHPFSSLLLLLAHCSPLEREEEEGCQEQDFSKRQNIKLKISPAWRSWETCKGQGGHHPNQTGPFATAQPFRRHVPLQRQVLPLSTRVMPNWSPKGPNHLVTTQD